MRAVARYTNSPSEIHWKTAVGILEYVFFTSDFGITFQRGGGLELVAYADADYASKATDRRSVSGGAVICAGVCVCWFSRTRKCVTFSTTEAEYVALADTISLRVLGLGDGDDFWYRVSVWVGSLPLLSALPLPFHGSPFSELLLFLGLLNPLSLVRMGPL